MIKWLNIVLGLGGLAFYAIIANFCVRQIIKHSRRLISEKKKMRCKKNVWYDYETKKLNGVSLYKTP